MNLHIISKSPYSHDACTRASKTVGAGDIVLFIDDGVYVAANPSAVISSFNEAAQCFVLDKDVSARGVSSHLPQATLKQFVQWSFEAKHVLSWY